MTYLTKKLGSNGEDIAVQFLLGINYRIVERNYVFRKGEIDIIAKSPDDVLVFIEVKTRKSENYGEPEFALTKGKQKQIIRTAEGFLFERDVNDTECRFDVVAIQFENGEPVINHIEHAFMKGM